MRFNAWKRATVAAPCFGSARLLSATALRFESSNDTLDAKNRQKATMRYGIDNDKLKLKLNFETMNFDKIAEATKDAQQREKSKVYVRSGAEEGEKKGASTPTEEAAPSSTPQAVPDEGAEAVRRSYRGIEGIGDIVTDGTPAALQAHRNRESRGGAARYTLADTLRDCSLSGNATKALQLFDGALEKACHSVLLPACKGTIDHIPENEEEAKQLLKEKESECLEMLRRLVAALPPPYIPGALEAAPRQPYRGNPKKHLSGLLRWNGRHFYLVLKTLFEADRLEEAERVWDILTRLGYIEYHLDSKMTNNLIALARRSGEDVQLQRLRNPLSESQAAKKTEDVVDHEKVFRRRVIVELEASAKRKNIALTGKNVKTAQTARIAQALSHSDLAAESGLSASEVEGKSLRVGDFNGLLRGARSHQATMRILGMMDKLQVEKTADVYAAIISALHHPEYLVEGADPAEVVVATQPSHTTEEQPEGQEHHAAPSSDSTKSSYEAYKEKRIAAAKQWFEQCDVSLRNAELYNHYLYMLRSPSHEAVFNEILAAFRGNTVRTAAEAQAVQQYLQQQERQQQVRQGQSSADAATGEDENKQTGFVPVILPPQWTCRPNGKTYEMLILRCRYLHDWPAMWALLEEMQLQKVRGTQRLYNILIGEAKLHPPTVFKGRKIQDSARVIMGLYRRMREDRLDVNSLDNTVNLVNAWSSVRNKRNWS